MPPTMLIESLQGLRRRVKLFGVMYGVGVVVAAAVGLLLAVVFLDWLLALPRTLRVLVNLAAIGTLGYALYRWVVRPALARMTLSDLAGRLENVFPQFDDTLRSTVNFMAGEVPGSEVMKQRTIARASEVAKSVDLDHAVQLKPVWYSSAMAVGAVLLLGVLVSLVDPTFRRIAANRLFGGAEAWPKSVEIAMLSDVPQVVPVGQSVDVKMKLKKGTARQAVLYYRYDDGRWEKEIIQPDADGVYSASVAARLDANRDAGKLQIRVEAGDDAQSLTPVTVVPRLDIKSVVAMVTPPEYANLPASPVQISERPVVSVLGATVELQVTFNKPLNAGKGVTLSPSDKNRKAPEVQWSFPAGHQAFGRFQLGDAFKPNDPFRFTVKATDANGFENAASQEYQVIVHDDAMPSVQIEEPRRNEERTPNATVPIKAVAEDDYGIQVAELVVRGVSTNVASKAWTIPLLKDSTVVGPEASWQATDSSTERKRFRLEYQWDLAKLEGANLKPGDQLEFFLRVKDNFRFNGNEHPFVESGKLRVTIISHEQWEVRVEEILSQMRQEIGQIKKTQDTTKAENEAQAQEAAKKEKFDDAQRATVGRLANQQTTATAQAKQASDKLRDLIQKMTENKSPEQGMKETAKDVAGQMDKTAEGVMKQASQAMNQAKDTKSDPKASKDQQKADAQKAAEAMQQASQQQGEASKQLEQAMNKLNDFGGLSPAIQKIEAIRKEQEKVAKDYKEQMKGALGKKPEDMTAEEKKAAKDLTQKQDELSQRTEKALNDMDSKADKMAKMDPSASKAMKDAAQTGKQQGIPQKQSNKKDDNGASQDMQKNQQANAQQKHKEIDLGLEMMLSKLKEAERRKLEELQKELAEIQKLIEELVARQAAHNIDNLLLQDVKKVTDTTAEARTELFDLARRDPAKLGELKPDLAVLTPSQEQTERNARDYAKRAESLPEPAPAAKLTTAASKMEQAIVNLRKAALGDAYPQQVDALAALRDALAAVDEMKKKADDQLQQQNEETIKQAYVKLLEAQKKLDAETKEIDGTQRDKDGNLPLFVARRLGQLPGEQGKLATDAEELGKKLEALGSVVYKWANKDIVTTMGEVKDDLAKPDTGVVVQADQKRIEEQLEAMINNLVQKKEKSKFAQNGGGGGGQCKPNMPTEIELRMLKALQEAVNKNTLVVDTEVKKNEGKKDAQKLLALGGRQGEIRNLLDQVMQKATQGQVKLGKEPDNKDQLPEEATKEAVDEQELVKNLLDDNADEAEAGKTIKLTGDRMARSRQRLALNNDPGNVTQEIQKKIVLDLEDMIKLAQQQQAETRGQPKPGQQQGQQAQKPKLGQQQQGPQEAKAGQKPGSKPQIGGNSPADQSSLSQGGDPQTDASKEDLKSKLAGWGGITPRVRDAVMEGRNERLANERYRKFVDDYYREVAKKASERQ